MANEMLDQPLPAMAPVPVEKRLPLATRLSPLALHFAERRLLLALGDTVMLILALVVSVMVNRFLYSEAIAPDSLLLWPAALAFGWLVAGVLFGLYDFRLVANGTLALGSASVAIIVTTVIFQFTPGVAPPLHWPSWHIVLLPGLAIAFVGLWRSLFARLMTKPSFHRRVLIIGTGRTAQSLARTIAELTHSPDSSAGIGYRVIGFLDDACEQHNYSFEGRPVLGAYPDLADVVDRYSPDEIVIAISQWQEAEGNLLAPILAAQERGVRITTMTMIYEQLTGRLALQQAGQRFDIVLPLRRSGGFRVYLAIRRVVEIAISLVGCLIVLAVIPLIWLTNRLSSPGPLFLHQERVGLGGRPFMLFKFRSMVVNAEKNGAVWAVANDPRITPVGRWLRRTRLDETPQFWNILKGDMSLIGPRPERPQFVDRLSANIPFYRVRHCVPPALTGWAQVQYRYASSINESLIKLEYDLYYVKHQSLMLDLVIMLRTIQIVLGFKGT